MGLMAWVISYYIFIGDSTFSSFFRLLSSALSCTLIDLFVWPIYRLPHLQWTQLIETSILYELRVKSGQNEPELT